MRATWAGRSSGNGTQDQRRQLLQLRSQGLSARVIAAWQSMSRHRVQAVIDGAELAGLDWDDAAGMPGGQVREVLFPGRGVR